MAMTLAILCSGQGLQNPDMFALTGDAVEAADLFAHATGLLGGRDPRKIVREVANDDAHQNRTGQILCTLQALAAAAALRTCLPNRLILAGYSVGEVASWGVARLWSAAATLDIATRRAELMDAASQADDGLLFVRGLPLETVAALCARHGAAIAIVNPADAYVLGGAGEALDALTDAANGLGAGRVVRIKVAVASHTPRMAAAAIGFRSFLAQSPIQQRPDRSVRLFSGVDGAAVVDIATGLDKLARQVRQTVHWADCLAGCVEAGAHAFLELGPGRALSEMCASAYPQIPARSLEDFRTIQGVRRWMMQFAE
jgi:[acyl-carrier-protein] S-malonyltransferase